MRGDPVHVQDVDAWVSCWILRLWSEQRTTDFRIGLAFAAASFCGFSEVHLRLCPNLPFVRAGVFLACTYECLRLSIYLHNLRNYYFVLF